MFIRLVAIVFAATGAIALPAAADSDAHVVIDRQACQRLVAHFADGEARYRGGVDVRGEAVLPADLGTGPAIVMPSRIVFELLLPLGVHSDEKGPRRRPIRRRRRDQLSPRLGVHLFFCRRVCHSLQIYERKTTLLRLLSCTLPPSISNPG